MRQPGLTKLVVSLAALLLSGCLAPQLSQEQANTLPPFTLCKDYQHWSAIYAAGTKNTLYSESSVRQRLRTLYEAVRANNIDCNKELASDRSVMPNQNTKMITCLPNEATGGVSCF
jgi:hypothetical protein